MKLVLLLAVGLYGPHDPRSSAFDSVPHEGIMEKLPSYGIRGTLLSWVRNFLGDRTQAVTINGTLSDWLPVVSGVPQGSSIAPTLFIIFVNDLTDYLNRSCLSDEDIVAVLYADDTMLSCRAKSCTVAAKKTTMLLRYIEIWASDWGMLFNAEKRKLMLLNPDKNTGDLPTVFFQDKILEYVYQHKHLGITISNDLRLARHAVNTAKAVAKDVFLLKCLAENVHDNHLLLTIYKSYIRPKLEYGCPAWCGMNLVILIW